MRAQRRQPTLPLRVPTDDPDTPNAVRDIVDPNASPEEWVLRRDISPAVRGALAGLPDPLRLTVILADVQGFTYEEIAQATGVEMGTVKSRLSRGRTRLRDSLLMQPRRACAT